MLLHCGPIVKRQPRIAPAARRRQILDVAAALLTDSGVDSVQITTVALAVGVSRPLVYRLFPTRQTLLVALLEDFVSSLHTRFQAALMRALPGSLAEIVGAFVEACCEAIRERGAGPWRLLDARGADPELTRLGRTTLGRLLQPWYGRIAELSGLRPRRAEALMWVVVAAGRASLDAWLDGKASRKQAVHDTTRAVTALLREFAGPAG